MPTDDFDDDDRPRRRRNSRDDDFDDDGRDRRSYDEDDFDDEPRRKRRRRRKKSEGLAIASMIVGIIAIPIAFCCGLFSLPLSATAIILGFVDRSQNGSNGKATAGIICGFVALVLMVASIILGFMFNLNQANWQNFGK
jgi:hypothetical protein